jgi:catechol 2,3-dioxygenase-like lactoylglutathione lyase family enzyme
LVHERREENVIREAFAVLPAKDLERARRWYADKFQIEPVAEAGGGLIYSFGAGSLYLYPSPNAGTAKSTAAGFVVDDLTAAMAALRSRGVRFEEYAMDDGPSTVDGVATNPSAKSAWFTDSEGNIVNLIEVAQ